MCPTFISIRQSACRPLCTLHAPHELLQGLAPVEVQLTFFQLQAATESSLVYGCIIVQYFFPVIEFFMFGMDACREVLGARA